MLGKCHNELKETEKARTNCKLAIRELNGINKDWAKELRKELQKCSMGSGVRLKYSSYKG